MVVRWTTSMKSTAILLAFGNLLGFEASEGEERRRIKDMELYEEKGRNEEEEKSYSAPR